MGENEKKEFHFINEQIKKKPFYRRKWFTQGAAAIALALIFGVAAGVMFAGLVGMFFARSMPAVIVTGCVMMSGYMLVTAILSGVIRDHTPAGKAGHFQGIRMIFGVLLPMILGPAIGAAVIRGSDSTYVDLGVVKTVPTPSIFLAAAVVLLLILPPVLALRKKEDAAC